jgi:hypothetical protein
VIGVDCDERRLQAIRDDVRRAGGSMACCAADLASPSDIAQLLDELTPTGAFDCVIHNAGVNCVGRFVESDLGRQRALLDVNLLAPMLLTAGLLERRLLTPSGSFVFVSSLSQFVSYPGAAVYAASKAALASYARSLSVALAGRGTHVLTVFPGPTRTSHARRHAPDNRSEHKRMPPEQVADAIFTAVRARRRVLVPGVANRLFAAVGRLFPRAADFVMQKAILEKLDANLPSANDAGRSPT